MTVQRSLPCFQLLLLLLLLFLQQLHPLFALSTGRSSRFSTNLPEGLTQSGKLRAFMVCRKECIAKCDRLVYVYSEKKEFCHECLKQCISAVAQQARSLGVDLNAVASELETRPQMQADSAAAAATAVADDGLRGSSGGRRNRRAKKRLDKTQREERRRRRRRQRERNRKRRREADRAAGRGRGGGGGSQQGLLKNCIVH